MKILKALVAAMVMVASSQSAVLTYSTFTGADPDSSETKATFGADNGALAQSFRTSTSGNTLSSVSFDLARTTGAATTARLRVYAGDDFSNPALWTGSVSLTGANGVPTITTFTGMSISLTANQTYWLVVDSTLRTMSVASAAGNQAAFGPAGFTTDGYRVYNEALTDFGGSTITADLPNFSVTVPEPHEYALVAGLGLCLFAAYRRRAANSISRCCEA